MDAHPLFTIGHSTRSLEEFLALLREAGVRLLVDVRAIPRSRTNPQFNIDTLPGALAAAGVEYRHVPALGGRRGRSKEIPPETNAFWENDSFHNYADYALTPDFGQALQDLRAESRERACALMCSEAVWWRCHRRIIADHLVAAGEDVRHILSAGKIEPARLTEGAAVRGGTVLYPLSGPAR